MDFYFIVFIYYYLFAPAVTENMPGVVDVRFVEREPAEKRNLLSWEQVERFTN